MRTIPRGLLLDFGSVITYSLFEKHRATEAILGLPEHSLTWMGPLDPSSDELWRAMQNDQITERDYWARRADEIGRACGETGWDMHALLSRVRHTQPNDAIRTEMRALVCAASRAGIKVGILSNELELFYGGEFLNRLDIMADIAVVIDGSHARVLKPDAAAYHAAADAMRLPMAQLLFVDDQFRNIVGAQAVGLQCEYFDLRDTIGCIAAISARLDLDYSPGATQ